MEGIVVPLHNDGDEPDMGNYRGITLGGHIGKVFLFCTKGEIVPSCEQSCDR